MIFMEYRVEDKYLVTDADLALIAGRLRAIMRCDEHQKGACYEIRSLYFDDEWDRCMDDNEAGVDRRFKYRIRTYGSDRSLIRLEIKEKAAGKTKKRSCRITAAETEQIMSGMLPLRLDERAPLNLLQMKMRCDRMRPKAIIAYERTAFVYPTGNVRITFDRNIAASRHCDDFLREEGGNTVPVLPAGMHILEVKYDELLPDFIAEQLEIGTLRQTAFSKYYLGRLAIQGEFPVGK